MSTGRFSEVYLYSTSHPDIPACKTLLELAALYRRHQDVPTLGLIEGAAEEVRQVMLEEVVDTLGV